MFCVSSQSHRFLFHSCTQDVPCCTHPDHDAPLQRDTCDRSMCKGSDRHQRLFSFFDTKCFRSLCWNVCLRQVILASVRIPHVVSSCATHLIACTCSIYIYIYDFDVTSGGRTGRLWWTAVVHVYCGVDEQLVSRDPRQRSENSQTW